MTSKTETLPIGLQLGLRHVLDFTPTIKLEPNHAMLAIIKKVNAKQSKISKKRQNFITGMDRYRLPTDERKGRAEYMNEWEYRARENV